MARTQDGRPAPDASVGSAAAAWAAADGSGCGSVGAEAEARALREEVDGLRRALLSHPVIDLARGIIMATAPCTPEQAWQVLVDVSQHTNIKLRDIAQRIVDSVDGPPPEKSVRAALRSALGALPPSGP